MRSYSRFAKRGFTLVELMIVVAIIGVLAALAIYGVTKYLASAKTSEAKDKIGAISRGAVQAYEKETTASEMLAAGGVSTNANHAFCLTAPAVPTTIASVQNTKYQPNPEEGSVDGFEQGDVLTGWKCLKFSLNQPIYYQYGYDMPASTFAGSGGYTPGAEVNANVSFVAWANGDLDGDGTFALFARDGSQVGTTGEVTLATQVFIENEFE